jgi:hypothetical protein
VINFLLKVLLMLGLYRLIPWLVSHAYFVINDPKDKPRNILWSLGKLGQREDLEGAIENHSSISAFEFWRSTTKLFAAKFLDRSIDDNSYSINNSSKILNQKMRYREFWKFIFLNLPKERKPSVIITGNFGYFAEREMAAAAVSVGIKFIALHKECLKSPDRLKFFQEVYRRRGRFEGSRIFVYNNLERQLQITSGVVEAEKIEVIGMPRLDKLHNWRTSTASAKRNPKTILAFGFTSHTGLPRIPRKLGGGRLGFEFINDEHKGLSWKITFQKYMDTLIRFAEDFHDTRVILKLKPSVKDSEEPINYIGSRDTPENLAIIRGGEPTSLIKQATVVCGFNTTSIFEAIAAGIPCITPCFGEAADQKLAGYKVDYGNGISHANSETEFYTQLKEFVDDKNLDKIPLNRDRKKLLNKWVYNSDGCATVRLQDALARAIKSQDGL